MSVQVITSAQVPLAGVRVEAPAPVVFSSQAGLASFRRHLTVEAVAS